ncbi:MAG: hypothetical protein IPH75_05155 [bacterium]|nr:hypothetical protein [bacterium]
MKPILIAGTTIVNLALISYSIAIITEQRQHRVTPRVRTFLTAGVILDITATACMIIGSTNSPFTLHGILGYSSLAAMTVDTVFIWRHWLRNGEELVPRPLHLYSRYAYLWWVAAYITGASLVLFVD